MAQNDRPAANGETSQITQNPEFQGLQQQVNDLAKQMSTIIALLSSGTANAPAPHNAAPPTPRHSDVQDQLPPGCVYTTDLPFGAQAQTSAPPQANNQLTTPNTIAA